MKIYLKTLLVCLFFISCNKDEIKIEKEEKYSITNKKSDQPPSSQNVQERFYAIVKEKLSLEDTDMVPAAHLINDLGADELDMIEIVMAVEAEFIIEIEDDEAEKLLTLGQFVQFIYSRLQTVVITPGGGGGNPPIIIIPNPGGGEGGGGTPGSPGGSTGGGNSGNNCGGLPALIIPILRGGDTFECATPNSTFQAYASASEFASYIDGPSTYSDSSEELPNGERLLRFKVLTQFFPVMGEEFFVKIKKNETNNLWQVVEVTSDDWGTPIFSEWHQIAYTVNVSNGISQIEVVGKRHFNVVIEGIGTIYRQERKYRIKIHNASGTKDSIIKI